MSAYKNEDLFKSLAELEVLDSDILKLSFKESNEQNVPLGEVLLGKDLINDNNLGKIIADLVSLPFVNLAEISIPEDVLKIIPEEIASTHGIISYKNDAKNLYIATNDPGNKRVLEFLSKKS